MILLPAIDLLDGKCVRLKQGDYNQSTRYNEDPIAVARQWEKHGAKILHIVDLDGAKEGSQRNLPVIEKILQKVHIPIQLGGGIRRISTVKTLIDLGVSRVILGTAALEDPEFLEQALKEYGEKIAVSIDTNKGCVALRGWLDVSEVKGIDFAKSLEGKGLKTLIYTDIQKDGMMQGPNFEVYRELKEKTGLKIIASGGVSTVEDLKRLQSMDLYGAIVGRALYENPEPFYPYF